MIDWEPIKSEYITTQLSYGKLAEKYGVYKSQIARIGAREHWPELRKQYASKVLSKTLAASSRRQAKKLSDINDLADKLLDKLEAAADQLDQVEVKTKTRIKKNGTTADGRQETVKETENVRIVQGTVDAVSLRQLSAALKDLKEIKGLLDPLAKREQEARIAMLKKQAEKADDISADIVVQMEGLEDYAE